MPGLPSAWHFKLCPPWLSAACRRFVCTKSAALRQRGNIKPLALAGLTQGDWLGFHLPTLSHSSVLSSAALMTPSMWECGHGGPASNNRPHTHCERWELHIHTKKQTHFLLPKMKGLPDEALLIEAVWVVVLCSEKSPAFLTPGWH